MEEGEEEYQSDLSLSLYFLHAHTHMYHTQTHTYHTQTHTHLTHIHTHTHARTHAHTPHTHKHTHTHTHTTHTHTHLTHTNSHTHTHMHTHTHTHAHTHQFPYSQIALTHHTDRSTYSHKLAYPPCERFFIEPKRARNAVKCKLTVADTIADLCAVLVVPYSPQKGKLLQDWIPYDGFLSWQIFLGEFCISVAIRESFLRKIYFKQLDTTLVGVVHWVTQFRERFLCQNLFSSNLRKVSPTKETR